MRGSILISKSIRNDIARSQNSSLSKHRQHFGGGAAGTSVVVTKAVTGDVGVVVVIANTRYR